MDLGTSHNPPLVEAFDLVSVLLDLTRYTGLHVAHHVIELRLVDTGRGQVGAAPTDRLLGIGVGAA